MQIFLPRLTHLNTRVRVLELTALKTVIGQLISIWRSHRLTHNFEHLYFKVTQILVKISTGVGAVIQGTDFRKVNKNLIVLIDKLDI